MEARKREMSWLRKVRTLCEPRECSSACLIELSAVITVQMAQLCHVILLGRCPAPGYCRQLHRIRYHRSWRAHRGDRFPCYFWFRDTNTISDNGVFHPIGMLNCAPCLITPF